MHPILVNLPFGLPLYAYGAMLTLSVIAGRVLAVRLAARAGIEPRLADRCSLWTFVGAIVGARLLYVVTNLDQFDQAIDVLRWWKGGVVAYGGFLGGLAGSIVFCRIHRVRVLAWADCAIPSVCLGLILTRVGCFLAGCDFGRPWDGPWAVRFPAGSPAYVEQTLLGLLPRGASQSLPVHPTQLYESLAGVALLALVVAIRRRQARPGQALAAFALGYAVLRYLIEMVRADPNRGSLAGFSTSQVIALITFVSASAFLYLRRRKTESGRSTPAVTV